jgi:hypothetical protein
MRKRLPLVGIRSVRLQPDGVSVNVEHPAKAGRYDCRGASTLGSSAVRSFTTSSNGIMLMAS